MDIHAILASPEVSTFLIGLFISVVGGVFAFVGKELRALLNKKLSSEQLSLLMDIAHRAVSVAEQTGALKEGAAKKAEAIRVATAFINAYGLKVTEAQLDAAIEAAVYEGITSFGPLPVPADAPSA